MNRLQTLSRCVAGFIGALGGLALVGWMADLDTLKRGLPGFVEMNPLTAVCFVLAGASLLLLENQAAGDGEAARSRPGAARLIGARFAGAVVGIVGLLLFLRFALGWDCGLDQVLFRAKLADEVTGFPNRMAPNTALAFLLSGAALVLASRNEPPFIRGAQYLALLTAFVALLALLGYAYHTTLLYGVVSFIPMALPTALAFLGLGLALLFARPEAGLAGILSSQGTGGRMARRLLPAALVIPAALGGVRLWGEQQGLFDTEFGVMLHTVVIMVLFTALVWWTAGSLEKTDAERRRAEAEIHKLAAFPRVNPRPVMEFAADGTLTYFNNATKSLAEALGQSLPVNILPPNCREIVATCLATGTSKLRLETRHGDRCVSWSFFPIPDTRVVHCYAADITDVKRTQEERDLYYSLTPDMLCIAGFDGYFRQLNPAWETTLGFTSEELKAQPFIEFVHPEDRESTRIEAGRIIAGKETRDFENRYRCKDGSYKWLLWSSTPLADQQLIFASARDTTERRQAQEQILSLNAQLEQRAMQLEAANQELESFSYSVSHDLRAPLRHIHGFVDLLTKRAGASLDDQSRRYLKVISDAARKMGQLIDDLLIFSRMGRIAMQKTTVPLQDLVREAIASHQTDLAGRPVEWVIHPLPSVEADRAMLRQVVVNLIDNAIKYTRARTPARIEFGCCDDQPGEWIFFIRDNGAGFDMRYAHKLFGVFQRLHSEGEFEGTGIGLANIRRIITRHAGRTWAEGKVAEGATFYFSLPKSPGQSVRDTQQTPT